MSALRSLGGMQQHPGWGPPYGYQQPPPVPPPKKSPAVPLAIGCVVVVLGGLAILGAIVGPRKERPAVAYVDPEFPAMNGIGYAYDAELEGGPDLFDDERSVAHAGAKPRARLGMGARVRRVGGNSMNVLVEPLEGPWKGRRLWMDGKYLHVRQKPGIGSPYGP